MSEATLALPAGPETRRSDALTVTALVAGIAGVMVIFGLFAAYFEVRALAPVWPAKKVSLDNYLGTTLTITMLMSSVTAEWAVQAMKIGNRRHALTALALTPGFGLAFLNLLWYLVAKVGFGPGSHAYGTLFYAFVGATVVNVVVGIGFLLVALLRTFGHQVTPSNLSVTRAASGFWHFVSAAWLLTFVALYVLQHR
ncbi:MAG: heme-copper oxidase subunit III [Actinobacteria bacterium]|nr:heme-copper oxidase subunit III [Actinomycetota bacterium]MBV9252748.1 heme-copper oxidase subunit III [Actinomycetota bacterium]MBV9935827.1 heme-copper oxidase subunit III [Actinomycetota bacterium]